MCGLLGTRVRGGVERGFDVLLGNRLVALLLVLLVGGFVVFLGPLRPNLGATSGEGGTTWSPPRPVAIPQQATGTPTITGPAAPRVRVPGGLGWIGAIPGAVRTLGAGACVSWESIGEVGQTAGEVQAIWEQCEAGGDAQFGEIADWLGWTSTGESTTDAGVNNGTCPSPTVGGSYVSSGSIVCGFYDKPAYAPFSQATTWQRCVNPPTGRSISGLTEVTLVGSNGSAAASDRMAYSNCQLSATAGYSYAGMQDDNGDGAVGSADLALVDFRIIYIPPPAITFPCIPNPSTGAPLGCESGKAVGDLTRVSYPPAGWTPTGGISALGTLLFRFFTDLVDKWGPADPEAPPSATHKVETTCRTRAGTVAVITRKVPEIIPGQSVPEIEIPRCEDELPGSARVGTRITTGRPDSGEPDVEIDLPVFDEGIPDEYPDCVDGSCKLEPEKDGEGCFGGGCGDLADRPGDETVAPPGYQCKWGTYTVPWSWCAGAYPPEVWEDSPPRETPTPTPTGSGTAGPSGSGTASPSGEPSSSPSGSASPSGEPSASGSASASPSQGFPTGGPNPTAPPPGAPEDVPDGESSNCWGEGWSWNPISWVFIPVKCALLWAFVPPAGTWEATLGGAVDKFDATGPGLWLGAGGEIVTALDAPGAGNCAGPTISFGDLPMVGPFSFQPLNACDQPVATVRWLIFAAASVAVVLGGAYACLRLVAAALGLQIPWLGRGDKGGGES